MRLAALLAAVLSMISAAACAQGLTDIEETVQLCEQAAASFSRGEYEEAFDILRPNWPLPDEEIDAAAYQSRSQAIVVTSRFGAPVGIDHASTSTVGESFVRHIYLLKYERHAIRFICDFYRPRSEWIINSVNWDDQIGLMLE